MSKKRERGHNEWKSNTEERKENLTIIMNNHYQEKINISQKKEMNT